MGNAFGITLTTLGVVSFIALIGYMLKWYIALNQQKRCKAHFAKVMADRMGHVGRLSDLDPKELEEEFKRIDVGLKKDGKIQKDELWAWLQCRKSGIMSEQDFEALFSTMDIDGDGSVTFIEFCGFMAKCESEYDREPFALKMSILRSLRSLSVRRSAHEKMETFGDDNVNNISPPSPSPALDTEEV